MKKRYLLIVLLVTLLTSGVGIALLDKKPVNILVYGLEGKRTDTMMLVMLQPGEDEAHIINIPRDTYYPTPGRNKLGQAKLNATFGFKEGGGKEGLMAAVTDITGVEIDYYVEVDYTAVKKVVDVVGGVEIDVPFDMKYDDPTATPPLHIDFKKGLQTINGDHAIEFLRFRKSNDGSIREGDVQRIGRQQEFIKQAVKKSLSYRLPWVVAKAMPYVKTDANIAIGVKMALSMAGMTQEDLNFHMLPQDKSKKSKDGLSYYFYQAEATHALIEAIDNNTYVKPPATK